ncbi:hypothetical protein CRG98_020658 [Punica granatum]|uniref:Uncharacterized protein n=1 Tax=Punica granatum TaxID=22663 RepID=A0A2I0JRK4_PUNGR|nr:hypothetical protein CRG98_020658 [Punica granatum]
MEVTRPRLDRIMACNLVPWLEVDVAERRCDCSQARVAGHALEVLGPRLQPLESVLFTLGYMNLDYALREEDLPAPTDTDALEVKEKYE